MFQIGDLLQGRYRILGEIGSGGIGTIFLAEDLNLETYVVVKKIKENFVDRLETRVEVDILKRLRHTYLPRVLDFFQNGSEVYTVMDYIEGWDLQQYLDQRIEVDEGSILRWLDELLEVLNYLHTQKPPIYHCDIKPANIMITPGGDVCLIDFNISLGDDEKTMKGLSRWYSAPEQRLAAQNPRTAPPVDERMDLYSLGASFFAVMTGFFPNPEGESIWTKEAEQRYSEGLLEILSKSMCQERNRRFSSALKMKDALKNLHRWGKRQRLFWFLRLGVYAVSAVFIACGISMTVYGVHRKNVEAWEAEQEAFQQSALDLDQDEVVNAGVRLLNSDDAQRFMTDEEQGNILWQMGDACYQSEDYRDAAKYYGQAVRYLSDNLRLCLDYTVSLVRNGQIQEAEDFISDARVGGSQEELTLLKGEIALKKKEGDRALELAQSLYEQSSNSEMRFRSCVLAADVYEERGSRKDALDWLEKAVRNKTDLSAMRRLVALASELANEGEKEMWELALSYGKKICDTWPLSRIDRVNLAVAQNGAGMEEEAFDTLLSLEAEDSDLYQIPMYLAVLTYNREIRKGSEEEKNFDDFLAYYEKASQKYRDQPYDEQDEELMAALEVRYNEILEKRRQK